MKFLDRMKSLIGVGALGSGTIAALGDFFAPKGGWMLTLAAGIISTLLCLHVLLAPRGKNLLYRLTDSDEEASGWWTGPLLGQHGLHVLITFSVVCLSVGYKSYAHASTGGIAGSNVQLVADAQGMAGLLQQSLIEQRKTRDQLTSLSATVKKETSDNPEKELDNRGYSWTTASFENAIKQNDVQAIDLFFKGKYDLTLDGDKSTLYRIAYMFDEFTRHRVALDAMRKNGFDFLRQYVSPDGRPLKPNPLSVSIGTKNDAAFEWLMEGLDKDRLKSYGYVVNMLLSGNGCLAAADRLSRIHSLIDLGLPADSNRIETYEQAYERWFHFKHKLPPMSESESERIGEENACKAVASLLEPPSASLRNAAQLRAKESAKAPERSTLNSEIECIDTALSSMVYKGEVISRVGIKPPPRDDEEVPFRCVVTRGLGGYQMYSAKELRSGRSRQVLYLKRLNAL